MIRFARTCLIRTTVLTKQLEQTLGPGTAELAMRIGIHSGSVTAGTFPSFAWLTRPQFVVSIGSHSHTRFVRIYPTLCSGVLRSQKARFQLFGDTYVSFLIDGPCWIINVEQLNSHFLFSILQDGTNLLVQKRK